MRSILKRLPTRTRTIVTFIVLLACLGILMAAHFFFLKKSMPHSFPTLVDAEPVKVMQIQPEIQSVGTVHAMQGIMVKAETGGRITHVYFESGKYVEAGTPLIQIYSDTLKAELAANNANLKLSKAEFERQQTLFQKGVGSSSALDQARAKMEADKANVDRIQAELDQTLIKAPFSGRLGLRLVELGEYISPGTSIVNLQTLDPMRVDFSIPEIYLSKLGIDQKVIVKTRSYPDESFTGTVYAYDSVVDPNIRSISVRAKIPNASHKLIPGIFVQVSLLEKDPQNMITVPQSAIIFDEQGNYVYRIVDQHAIKTMVQLGPMAGDRVAIKKGLSEKDVVIFAGQQKIYDGSFVMNRLAPQVMQQMRK